MVAISKECDSILNIRLTQCFKPDLEQAVTREGRSRVEHILTIPLLMGTARKTTDMHYILLSWIVEMTLFISPRYHDV